MLPRFDYGDPVRVIRPIRNDGTYPGAPVGALLVRRGSVGHVRQVGAFLQNQIIYAVHFLDSNGRLVGCRETELIPASALWIPSRFENRDQVIVRQPLALQGTVVVTAGSAGEIIRVFREAPGDVRYHVRFGERTLQVPETALLAGSPHPGLLNEAEGISNDVSCSAP